MKNFLPFSITKGNGVVVSKGNQKSATMEEPPHHFDSYNIYISCILCRGIGGEYL